MTFDPFNVLSLPVRTERSSQYCTLEGCLSGFTAREVLSQNEAWKCPKCMKMVRTEKKIDLFTFPPILVIHLKRFKFSQRYQKRVKVSDTVSFPIDSLDLRKFLPDSVHKESDSATDQPVYTLSAVSNHHGSCSSGHFTAFVREPHRDERGIEHPHPSDDWLVYDDDVLQYIDVREVCTRDAYVLFYRKVSPSRVDPFLLSLTHFQFLHILFSFFLKPLYRTVSACYFSIVTFVLL